MRFLKTPSVSDIRKGPLIADPRQLNVRRPRRLVRISDEPDGKIHLIDVELDLLEGALDQKRRDRIDDRPQALASHAGRDRDHRLLAKPDVKEAARKVSAEFLKHHGADITDDEMNP